MDRGRWCNCLNVFLFKFTVCFIGIKMWYPTSIVLVTIFCMDPFTITSFLIQNIWILLCLYIARKIEIIFFGKACRLYSESCHCINNGKTDALHMHRTAKWEQEVQTTKIQVKSTDVRQREPKLLNKTRLRSLQRGTATTTANKGPITRTYQRTELPDSEHNRLL